MGNDVDNMIGRMVRSIEIGSNQEPLIFGAAIAVHWVKIRDISHMNDVS